MTNAENGAAFSTKTHAATVNPFETWMSAKSGTSTNASDSPAEHPMLVTLSNHSAPPPGAEEILSTALVSINASRKFPDESKDTSPDGSEKRHHPSSLPLSIAGAETASSPTRHNTDNPLSFIIGFLQVNQAHVAPCGSYCR